MKKIISSILIYALLLQVGCYSENWVSKDSLNEKEQYKIHIITIDNKEYYSAPKDWFTKKDTLVVQNPFAPGNKKLNTRKIIPFDSINEIYFSQFNEVNTILFISSTVLLLGVLLFAASYQKGSL